MIGKKIFPKHFSGCEPVVKNLGYVSNGKFSQKKTFFKKKEFESFLDLCVSFFGFLTKTLWQCGQNCILGVPRVNFHDKQCLWRNPKYCGHWANIFGVLRKISGTVSKTDLYVPKEYFQEKLFLINPSSNQKFWDIDLKTFVSLAKTFQPGFSKFHSKYPEEYFHGKKFMANNGNCFR